VKPAKREKTSKSGKGAKSEGSSAHFTVPKIKSDDEEDVDMDLEASTAAQWAYDPDNPQPLRARPANLPSKRPDQDRKQKARSEPEKRHAWLAEVMDIDRNKPGSPDYDPRTLYIPPMAWKDFSAFETQYWEIKQKWWDTIVFFKKGKFYELYEKDATIGHQLFDLKLTDRVNMRMVGVPESSLDHWAAQFVAKGYKIARVDQQETALGKEMRERDDEKPKPKAQQKKTDKVIKRELACVLTAGTLVDGTMLQSDMSTFCVAIKESEINDLPAFGVSFVDTSTSQFHIAQWIDDASLTKFETFIAQTRPQELLLEKGCVSVKAMRILKNNTGPTTIWNFLKPGKEFWEAHITAKEIEANDYFTDAWPAALEEAKDQDLLMSSLGALVHYLRLLKIEKDQITVGNFVRYDPIRKASTLVLDGQTLINLEIFNNTFDGGVDGTLFQLLNRCITPFGKRMLKQWVSHPLMDITKINARLDAVDSLNADTKVTDRFTSQMTKMPDLERLISRVHAKKLSAEDFVRVLDGFEQIDHTMSLLRDSGGGKNGEGVIGQLISAMPALGPRLEYWTTAFDRKKARDHGVLVPERGIEPDFDESQDYIEEIQKKLNAILEKQRKDLGSKSIHYRDVGKEIYQLEVPVKIKVPKHWDQMSATQAVKRYYFPELKILVRKLQEAQETHAQIVGQVKDRFCERFAEHYEIWLASTRIIAQLDCLISLAKASQSLGQPSCRPKFVEDDRSVMELIDLRHPCIIDNVDDFIPNDIVLGGNTPNMTLLTGANAAGKSTVLRMTCIATIMAQVGCYLPCTSARLTPVDRIMSRLGAQDHIFANQSTFFVELAETKKILTEATSRSLVILDELGRGTSSHDGVAVAQAVLHHLASQVGCLGFFATHYHSLAAEFAYSKEVVTKRMKILVDEEEKRVTFLYKLEEGVSEGSFGMHCAGMCGIPRRVIARAEETAEAWETTSRLGQKLMGKKVKVENGTKEETDEVIGEVPLGIVSDLAAIMRGDGADDEPAVSAEEQERMLEGLMGAIDRL
jgi:DNA mismatch repair protein MSH6